MNPWSNARDRTRTLWSDLAGFVSNLLAPRPLSDAEWAICYEEMRAEAWAQKNGR